MQKGDFLKLNMESRYAYLATGGTCYGVVLLCRGKLRSGAAVGWASPVHGRVANVVHFPGRHGRPVSGRSALGRSSSRFRDGSKSRLLVHLGRYDRDGTRPRVRPALNDALVRGE